MKTAFYFLEGVSRVYLRGRAIDNGPFPQVRQFLQEVLSDKTLIATAAAMQAKTTVFDQLRKALRIAEPDGNCGLNDDGDDIDIKTVKEKGQRFQSFSGRKQETEENVR